MSRILPDIPRHRRELMDVIEDGSAKTFVYKDLDAKPKAPYWAVLLFCNGFRRRNKKRKSVSASRRID